MDKIPKTMRAIVYRGPNDLRLEMLPVPRIAANELLVKVAACGVCPTDIKKIQYGTVTPPRIFGHETSGTIVRVGARVQRFGVGDRVALHHHIPCLDCHACRHRAFAQCATYKRTGITAGFEPAGGGYAEYVRVMPFVFPGVVKIPWRNSFLEGAMLEPVNTVLKGVKRLAILPKDNVLVVGQGPIGLLFTQLLALQKARVFAADFFETRLQMAKKYGAHWMGNPKSLDFEAKIRDSLGAQGLDAAVICAPSDDAVRLAQQLLNGGSKMLLFAHTKRGTETPVDLSAICVDEKDFIGSYSADVTLQKQVAKFVFSRKLDVRPLITHRFPLAETGAAVALAANPMPNSLKVVVGDLADKSM